MGDIRRNETRLTAEQILSWMHQTPSDKALGLETAVNWKSEFVGLAVRQLFACKHFLESMSLYPLVWWPWALAADSQRRMLEKLLINPIKTAARIAVRTGRHADIFAEQNEWTKSTYAKLIYDLCTQG
jgi:hypothetical protein